MSATYKAEVGSAALRTSTGTQALTISGFGTPTAAMVIFTTAITDDTVRAGSLLGVGFTDGTRAVCHSSFDRDDTGAVNGYRIDDDNSLIRGRYESGSSTFSAEFTSFSNDTMTITVSDAGTAVLVTYIFFNGADLSNVYAAAVAADRGIANDVTAPGFEPDIVFMSSVSLSATGETTNNNRISIGVGINDGSDTQRSMAIEATQSDDPSELVTYKSTSSIISQIENNAIGHNYVIGTYDANGFTITGDGTGGTVKRVNYLALKFANTPSIDLLDFDSPTTTGAGKTITGASSTPQYGMIFSPHVFANDTVTEAAGADGLAIAAFDDATMMSNAISSEDNAATTNTGSLSSNALLQTITDGGTTVVHTATFTSFDTNGCSFNYSVTAGTAEKWFALLIGAGDSDPPNLSLPTSASITIGGVTLGATTDDATGTSYGIVTASGDQSAPTNQEIIDGTAPEELFGLVDKSISSTGAYTHTALAGLTHNTDYGYAIVHEDSGGNEDAGSRVEGTFSTLEIVCALTGTVTPNSTEAEIVTGSKTIILTLTNDTWHANLGDDNAQTDALIAALTSDKAGVTGWDAVVKANMVFGDITRTSPTVCTIVLAAEATYDITSNETIGPIVIPAATLTSGQTTTTDTSFSINALSTGGSGGISNVITQKLVRQAKKRRKTRREEQMDHDKSVEEALEQLYGKD